VLALQLTADQTREAYEAGSNASRLLLVGVALLAISVVTLISKRSVIRGMRSPATVEDSPPPRERAIVNAAFVGAVCGLLVIVADVIWFMSYLSSPMDTARGGRPISQPPALTADTTVSSASDELRRDRARAEHGELIGEDERLPTITVDSAGVSVNGRPTVDAAALASTDLVVIEPLRVTLRSMMTHWQDVHEEAPTPRAAVATIIIAPETPAIVAGSVIQTVERLYQVVIKTGATTINLKYMRPGSPIPIERFLFVAPQAAAGYTLERQQITGEGKHGPRCRERSVARVVTSESQINAEVAAMCKPFGVDCVDHVVFALPANRPFGDVLPWISTASRARPLGGLVRFIASGSAPFPEAIICAGGPAGRAAQADGG
jgi:hypothetical protein